MNKIIIPTMLYVLSITTILLDFKLAAGLLISFTYIYTSIKLMPNVLFLIRQTIIFFVVLLIHVNISAGGLVSVHLAEFQNERFAQIAVAVGLSSLFFSYIAFIISDVIKVPIKQTNNFGGPILFFIVLSFFLISGYVISQTKEIAFVSAYGTYESEQSKLGNINTIIITLGLVILKLNNELKNFGKIFNPLTIAAFLYVAVWCMFIRGIRMDVLTLILGSYIYLKIISNQTEKTIKLRNIIVAVLCVLIFQIWGVLRSLEIKIGDVADLMVYAATTHRDAILLYQGTFNDIAATYIGIIGMVEEGILNHAYGETYLDYLLRTPPEFLFPSRPQSPAWIFNSMGYTSGGGFYELAEGYYNFGVAGAIMQSFAISLLLGLSYKLAKANRANLFYHIPIISFLACFFRGNIYETFTLYKSLLTVLIIILSVIMARKLLQK